MQDTIERPGISAAYLTDNDIRYVDANEARRSCGCPQPGLLIPYRDFGTRTPVHDPDGTPFCRLRKERPEGGNKYHQPAGTCVHAYAPTNSDAKLCDGVLTVPEGEFKSLALTDPNQGFTAAAIATPGFWGFQLKGEDDQPHRLAPELATAINNLSPTRLAYAGDNDTALNLAFSHAACRLRDMVPTIQVALPRISLADPKGLDDCRHHYGNKFETWFRRIIDDAVILTSADEPGFLALKLLDREVAVIGQLNATARAEATQKLVKMAARLSPEVGEQLIQMVGKALGIGKTEFRRLVQAKRRELAVTTQNQRIGAIRPAVAGFFFDGKIYHRRTGAIYTPLARRDDVVLHMATEGSMAGRQLSRPDLELGLFVVQKEHHVDFAGAVAGRQAGVYEEQGQRVLVTRGPIIISGSNTGDASLVTNLLAELFGDGEDEEFKPQVTTFIGWLQQGRRALDSPEVHLPGQLLALVGPADTGKGFAQSHIITPALGGRQADPTEWLAGRTAFNDSLMGVEHLAISDVNVDHDDKARTRFLQSLKGLVANDNQDVSAKFRSKMSLRVIQRITMSANLGAADLNVVPRPEGSMKDKVILLRCYPVSGLPAGADDRKSFLAGLAQALPAFLGQVDAFQLPESYQNRRFGVREYHHPELLKKLNATDPVRLLGVFLDAVIKAEPERTVTHTAREWYQKLESKHGARFTDHVQDARDLGRLFAQLKCLPGWAGRVHGDEKVDSGKQRNYARVWAIGS